MNLIWSLIILIPLVWLLTGRVLFHIGLQNLNNAKYHIAHRVFWFSKTLFFSPRAKIFHLYLEYKMGNLSSYEIKQKLNEFQNVDSRLSRSLIRKIEKSETQFNDEAELRKVN